MYFTRPATRSIDTKMIPQSIEEFNTYDAYIKNQLESLENTNTNIEGLECRRNARNNKGNYKITYQESVFEDLSDYIKSYYVRLNPNVFYGTLASKQSNISLTTIFKNDNEHGYFLPNSLVFTNKINMDLYEIVNRDYFTKYNLGSNLKKYIANNNLANAHMPNTHLSDVKYSKNLFNGLYNDMIANRLLTETRPQIDIYNTTFNEIYRICREENKSVCVLSYVSSHNGGFHSIAIVFWYSDNMLYSALYDPMYYEREGDFYVWAVDSIYITLTSISIKLGIPITIYNLSSMFCIKNQKGKHCIQYIIDAEYCAMYSLYFLYLYAKHDFPKRVEDLEVVVKETFIDTPEEITRNPCKATNKFRLVIMSFILTVLTLISNDKVVLGHAIKTVYDRLSSHYTLLEPTMLELLNQKIAVAEAEATTPSSGSSLSGGMRKYTRKRQYTKHKKHTKHTKRHSKTYKHTTR